MKDTTPVQAPMPSAVAVFAENNRIRVHVGIEESTPKSSGYGDNFKLNINVTKDYDLTQGKVDIEKCKAEVISAATSGFNDVRDNFSTIQELYVKKSELDKLYVLREVANKEIARRHAEYSNEITKLKAASSNPSVIDNTQNVINAINQVKK